MDGGTLRLQVEKLKDEEVVLEVAEKAEKFPALLDLQEQGQVRFDEPVRGMLRAFRADDYIEVQGRIETRAQMPCSRCLEKAVVPIAVDIALTFTPRAAESDHEPEEEVELQAEDLGLISFDGDEIDLHEALQEQIIMALPLRPLCNEKCQGLCPRCGVNRNLEDCECSSPVLNNKFAALKDFKPDR